MGDLADYTNRFFSRIYPANSEAIPDSAGHFINIKTDVIRGFGETSGKTPWGSEDDLVYDTSYRVEVFGEFYSIPQDAPYEFVQKVFTYPYIEDLETPPTGLEDESSWKNA